MKSSFATSLRWAELAHGPFHTSQYANTPLEILLAASVVHFSDIPTTFFLDSAEP